VNTIAYLARGIIYGYNVFNNLATGLNIESLTETKSYDPNIPRKYWTWMGKVCIIKSTRLPCRKGFITLATDFFILVPATLSEWLPNDGMLKRCWLLKPKPPKMIFPQKMKHEMQVS
jgi:hypothetical protein